MLSSIHPLGERSRNNRWGLTATAFVTGATMGGAALGLALVLPALVAGVLLPEALRWAVLVVAALVGLATDLRLAGRALPSWHRQVNEDWLGRYRGWVYGFGFGLQMGAGVAVYVTTALVYLTIVAAVMSGTALGALVIATTFGLTRGAVVLTASNVETPDDLQRYHARRARAARPARLRAAPHHPRRRDPQETRGLEQALPRPPRQPLGAGPPPRPAPGDDRRARPPLGLLRRTPVRPRGNPLDLP